MDNQKSNILGIAIPDELLEKAQPFLSNQLALAYAQGLEKIKVELEIEWQEEPVVSSIGLFYCTSSNINWNNVSQHSSKPLHPAYDGYVYILQAGEYYKIGHSTKPAQRFKQLSALPPWPTEIIHLIESNNYITLETQLHERFASKRANGEWFKLDQEDITWLRTL